MDRTTHKLLPILNLCLVALILFCGFTDTYRTDTPAGTDDPREADDRMREIKAANQQRQDVDHYWEASASSVYDAADTGKHRWVEYREPLSVPGTVAADEAITFTRDVSGKAEFHWIDEDENLVQITSGGGLYVDANTTGLIDGTRISNDTFYKSIDNAGTGTVDLIKANTSDVAVLPDGSELATSGAPTADADIANKKYVDDELGGAYTGGESITFGSGLIIKMGFVSDVDQTTVTFGAAFPNAIVSATMTEKHATSTSTSVIVSTSTSNIVINMANGTYDGAYWMAIGY